MIIFFATLIGFGMLIFGLLKFIEPKTAAIPQPVKKKKSLVSLVIKFSNAKHNKPQPQLAHA